MPSLIGQRIRELRIARGLTQTQLADDMVTPSMISQIEAGRAMPSETLLKRLAERLETPADMFFLTPSTSDVVHQKIEIIRTCILLQRYQEAEQLIEEAFTTPAGHVELNYFKTQLLIARKEFHAAFQAITTTFTLAHEQERYDLFDSLYVLQGDILFALGEIHTALHAFEQAKRYFERQLQQDSVMQAQLYIRLSECNHMLGQKLRSTTYAHIASTSVAVGDRSTKIANEYLSHALHLLQVGQEQEAGRVAAQARTMHQTLHWVESALESDLLLIMHHLDQGEIEEADDLISMYLERNSFYMTLELHTRLNYLIAETHLAYGQVNEAITIMDEIIAKGSDTPSIERLHALTRAIRALVYKDKPKLIELAQIALHDALHYRRLPLAVEISTMVSRAQVRMGHTEHAQQMLEQLDRTIQSI
ncbi:helix-turn-helix domain-containing protein [Sulfoacidibacillus ferrooxidans]|uniref:HTH cro/C1-type domain-containing protein n=1 Tax=Sulfoacidibacillus ferrooxidans TaxID=2005001 RepID=A0A9X1V8X5_9BACL|nr:helix-turn-helix domain-containing protein [Sulfoacidibacillus ferrooxidans]MCI0183468.1 hypothetical protein [Sulfoacidibacillus ferrooxidans]